MNFKETFVSSIKPYSSFEPAYFMLSLTQEFSEFTSDYFYFHKSCHNQTESEPANLSSPCDHERYGIEYAASIKSLYSIFNGFITLPMSVLISAWSDKAPNRPRSAILFLMSFRVLQLISMCFQAYFWYWPALAAFFTDGIFQTFSCVRITAIVYLCSMSSVEDRTFRLTLISVLELISSVIVNGSSGYLLHIFGFFYFYILCLALQVISLAYAAIFMKQSTSENAHHPSQGFIKPICEFFDLRSVVQAFRLVFGKRAGNERITIILLSVINVLSYLTAWGESSLLYLYLRLKFGFNEKDFGIFTLYKRLGICVGSMICMGINKYLKVADSALGMFAAFWDIVASFGFFFAENNWQLYLVPLFNIFRGFALNVCESTQSKFFKKEEFGRLFSAHTAVGILASISMPIYGYLFTKTIDFAPASIFLLSAIGNAIICILYGICHLLIKKMPKKD